MTQKPVKLFCVIFLKSVFFDLSAGSRQTNHLVYMKLRRAYKQTQGIAATRLRLGFTHESFARLLGISRSTLTMAEGRYRSLPDEALRKLSLLEIQLVTAPVVHPAEAQNTINLLPRPEESTGPGPTKTQHCQSKLNDLQQSYRQLQQAISDIHYLQQQAPPGTPSLLNADHLDMQLRLLGAKLLRCGLPAQARLSKKLAALQAAGRSS